MFLQGIEFMIPLHCLSLDRNAFRLLRCCCLIDSDKELVLQAKPLCDLGNMMRSEN